MTNINIETIKKLFWGLMDILLILFVLPFGFVMIHYFYLFFTGGNRLELLKNLTEFSLQVSWVSCAFLYLMSLILRTMILHHKRWYLLFAVSFIFGGLWIISLNFIIQTEFTIWRSLLPLTFCCVLSTGYALGKALYRDDRWNFAEESQMDYHENVREILEKYEETSELGIEETDVRLQEAEEKE